MPAERLCAGKTRESTPSQDGGRGKPREAGWSVRNNTNIRRMKVRKRREEKRREESRALEGGKESRTGVERGSGGGGLSNPKAEAGKVGERKRVPGSASSFSCASLIFSAFSRPVLASALVTWCRIGLRSGVSQSTHSTHDALSSVSTRIASRCHYNCPGTRSRSWKMV